MNSATATPGNHGCIGILIYKVRPERVTDAAELWFEERSKQSFAATGQRRCVPLPQSI
jgi:hypothetical protein